jgi:hypothetical protein
MAPATQANLLAALAVWKAQLPPAWVAMFQLLCVKQAEEGSMTADQLEQVGGSMLHAAGLRSVRECCMCARGCPCFFLTPDNANAQVLVALSALGLTPSTALAQQYFDASLPLLLRTSADSIAVRVGRAYRLGVERNAGMLCG